jgi:hypothetical protein
MSNVFSSRTAKLRPANCNRRRSSGVVSGMGMDSTESEPFGGGDPIDLDRLGLGRPDTSLVAAFRAGLEPDERQAHRVIARLPLIEAQARRSHRRRQVLASGMALAAVAAATALVATLPATPRAGAVTPIGPPERTPVAAPTLNPIPTVSPTSPTASRAAPTVKATTSLEHSSEPTPARYVFPITVLLPTDAITAFGDVRLDDSQGHRELGAQRLVSGVCVDARLPVPIPDHGGQGTWSVADPPAGTTVPLRLVERTWRWYDPTSATALFQRLEAQVAGCSSGPGRDGRGPTRRLVAPRMLSRADSVLVTAASDGHGNQAIQVVMLTGRIVVQLDAVIPDVGKDQQAAAAAALKALAPTARTALTRVLDNEAAR